MSDDSAEALKIAQHYFAERFDAPVGSPLEQLTEILKAALSRKDEEIERLEKLHTQAAEGCESRDGQVTAIRNDRDVVVETLNECRSELADECERNRQLLNFCKDIERERNEARSQLAKETEHMRLARASLASAVRVIEDAKVWILCDRMYGEDMEKEAREVDARIDALLKEIENE